VAGRGWRRVSTPRAPAWLLNLRGQPAVEVQIGRTRFPASAAEIGAGDPDYARLWTHVNDKNDNRYDAYQQKTTRPIPIVALSRVA
jgi:deazaflavin-dependent oxidoreductase (nitroreductase family)